jgi:hypothetical protein
MFYYILAIFFITAYLCVCDLLQHNIHGAVLEFMTMIALVLGLVESTKNDNEV